MLVRHTHIILALFYLLAAGYLPAQSDEPVELEEWCSFTGDVGERIGWGFSHLPDFDTADGAAGHNALAVVTGFSDVGVFHSPTWYMNGSCDTSNHFSWKQGEVSVIGKGDFNGDLVRDYITWGGRIYQGNTQGRPPLSPHVAEYPEMFDSRAREFFVTDINRDGFDDVITQKIFNGPALMTILFGGPDLTSLQTVDVAYANHNFNHREYFVDYLDQRSKNGNLMIIAQVWEGTIFEADEASYLLQEVIVTPQADTYRVERITLDRIDDNLYRPNASFFLVSGGDMVQAKNEQKKLFVLSLLNRDLMLVYEIENQKFRRLSQFSHGQTSGAVIFGFEGSVNNDQQSDWFINNGDYIYIYAGLQDNIVDTVPFARFRHRCSGAAITRYIGDVTGDGIGDIAVGQQYSSNGCFTIYAGVDRRAVRIERPVAAPRPFDMDQCYPHPVGRDVDLTIPVDIERAASYELAVYDMRGRLIASLFKGDLAVGRHRLVADLVDLPLSSGLYILRLGDGRQVRERGLLIR